MRGSVAPEREDLFVLQFLVSICYIQISSLVQIFRGGGGNDPPNKVEEGGGGGT